jgi:hypothetical protein
VRLAGGVADHGRAGRRGGGHQRVLGAHHGRLVHEEVARGEAAVRRPEVDVAAVLDGRAERAERIEVGIQAAPADHVAARRGQQRGAEAREQRAGDQERGADPLGEIRVDVGLVHVGGAQLDGVLAVAGHADAEVGEQLDQRLRVTDARDVVQDDRLGRQQRGGDQREGGILVAGGHDGSAERSPAFDHELLHKGGG